MMLLTYSSLRILAATSVTCVAVMSASPAQAASLVSEPVGCIRVTIPPPVDGLSTRKVLGTPFNRPSVYRGISASVTTSIGVSTLSCGTPGWTTGQFVREVHYLKIRAGVNAGRVFQVAANTANSVAVSAGTVSLGAQESFEIFPAQTLGSLFGTVGMPLRTGTSEATADLVRLHDGVSWVTYFHNGSHWRTRSFETSQDGAVLRPEQGIILVCGGSSATTLNLLGSVSVTKEFSVLPGSGETLFSSRLPVSTTLSRLQLQTSTGWKVGSTASQADTAMRWNGSSWNVYYHTGTRWQMAGSLASQDDAQIPVGEALLIRRQEGSTRGSTLISGTAALTFNPFQ